MKVTEQRICKKHGITTYVFEPSKDGYRCEICRNQAAAARTSRYRRELKQELVLAAGGECTRCGYSKSIWSLAFHHRDRLEKEACVSKYIQQVKRDLARKEAAKCDLLCHNCHGEIEEALAL